MPNHPHKRDEREAARLFGAERITSHKATALTFATEDLAAIVESIEPDALPGWIDERLATAEQEAGGDKAGTVIVHRYYRNRSSDLALMRASALAELLNGEE